MLEDFTCLLCEWEVDCSKTTKNIKDMSQYSKNTFLFHCIVATCVFIPDIYFRSWLTGNIMTANLLESRILFVCVCVCSCRLANQSRLPQALVMVGCSSKKNAYWQIVYVCVHAWVWVCVCAPSGTAADCWADKCVHQQETPGLQLWLIDTTQRSVCAWKCVQSAER